jgi:hypothetical protein
MKLWTDVRNAFEPRTAPALQRDPNALYQYGDIVGDVQGAVVSQSNSLTTFQVVRSNGTADPTRGVEYQNWVLSCPDLPTPRPNEIVGQFVGMIVGMKCTIVGKRSAQTTGEARAEPPHDDTFYGIPPPPLGLAQGDDNKVLGPTDNSGTTTIYCDTMVGSHACGGPGSVVIASHAMYGACNHN